MAVTTNPGLAIDCGTRSLRLMIGATFGLHDAYGMRSVLILLSFGAAGWIALTPMSDPQASETGRRGQCVAEDLMARA